MLRIKKSLLGPTTYTKTTTFECGFLFCYNFNKKMRSYYGAHFLLNQILINCQKPFE
jgi:hypothetical protein